MDVNILLKPKNKREKDIKFHHPKCPSCNNEDYKKLTVCHVCDSLMCEKCKEDHNL